ncbi:MAG TPA: hypothetical protein VK179_05340 [Bacteroidales bacterium]|nr:hypothetical protein [Bacteroidales bacterium]
MKIRYKPVLPAVFLCLVFSLSTFAQFDSPVNPFAGEGLVILHNGDTLHGRVNWRMKYVENNPTEIKFIPDEGSPVIYSASDVSEVVVFPVDFESSAEMPEEHYLSMPSMKKGSPVFFNCMINGKIAVYQNRSSTVMTNEVSEVTSEFDGIEFRYSKKEGLTVGPVFKVSYNVLESKTRYSSYFVSKNGVRPIKVEKENYENVFSEFFGDCPAIEQEIAKNPDLRKFKNFLILVEVYNHLCLD